jgi:predicted phosphate transport protein (TIGR00153 family)
MLERLMPRSDEFFDDFDKQAEASLRGVKLFKDLMDDFTDVKKKVELIKNVEHEGDEHTHHAFQRLHKQFITPFDRAEIHRLLSRIDDVLDLTDAAAERILFYELPTSTPDAQELAGILVEATTKMQVAVQALRHIKKPDQILEACKEINFLENQADTVLRAALGKLFKTEKDPLMVIKWKEIYDLIESATDRCEDVANVIEGVVLEHS